jgi:mandelamide amidase
MAHQGISRRQLIQSAAAGMLLGQGISALADGHASNPLLKLSAPQAVAAIQSGKVSATAYLQALLGQTQKHAGLNALVYLNEAQAMKAAANIDADRKAGKALKPLAGLIIVAKDNINTKDDRVFLVEDELWQDPEDARENSFRDSTLPLLFPDTV